MAEDQSEQTAAREDGGGRAVPSEEDFTEIVRILVERGADINARDQWGRTPLMIASREGYKEMVRILLDWEADIRARDKRGYTALMYAAWQGHLGIVKTLIERGADVNGRDEEKGWTALLLAAFGPEQHYRSRHRDDEDGEDEGEEG